VHASFFTAKTLVPVHSTVYFCARTAKYTGLSTLFVAFVDVMRAAPLEFWFDFASPYSYVAAMRIERLCQNARVPLVWRPFLLGPIFKMQGWSTSHFNLNERRKQYMWRDMERLTAKFAIPWRRPSEFPRNSTLPARIAAAFADAPWMPGYIRSVFIANFGADRDIGDEIVLSVLLEELGLDARRIIDDATQLPLSAYLRKNTEHAIMLGIFGAPNCIVEDELFWGEEALEDAVQWALTAPRAFGRT
jgi:2-hydroxychromene-2-carboxylate isomerase